MPHGLGWLAAVGPGVIVLGLSIGSGEFLLGPAVFVRHGLTLLCVTAVAILLQALFNVEVMRYTLATGEPVFTGFMRTRPSSTWWAWFDAVLYFLQAGWPAWAANAAGAFFFLYTRQLAGPARRWRGLQHGRRGVPAMCRDPALRKPDRAHARSSTGCCRRASSAASWCWPCSMCRGDTWSPGFRGVLGIDAETVGSRGSRRAWTGCC